MNQRPTDTDHERDPVAVFVERELDELARIAQVDADLKPDTERNVELRFGEVVVKGETRDIALLRLASALLQVERFRLPLTQALSPELHREAHAHAGVDSMDGSRISTSNV
jgi:hypothetical protein